MLLTLPISEVIAATPRARVVRLDLGDGKFPYDAGQAVHVGAHAGAMRKPYSLASSPEEARDYRRLELLVGLDEAGTPGGHLILELGALVDVDGPVGSFTFPPDPSERRFLFIAGGTGIAPLRAMLRHALAIQHREVGLLYSARSPDEFAYEGELRALAHDHRIELRQTITRGNAVEWSGGRGRIGRAELAPLVHDPETLCFVCGPSALVEGTTRLLQELGVRPDRIRVESWT